MNNDSPYLKKGTFVLVSDSLGIVVGWPNEEGVPDEHYAIWYGEAGTSEKIPSCRTVPIEYCEETNKVEFYH